MHREKLSLCSRPKRSVGESAPFSSLSIRVHIRARFPLHLYAYSSIVVVNLEGASREVLITVGSPPKIEGRSRISPFQSCLMSYSE